MGKWEIRTEGCVVPLVRDIESGVWIGHSDVADYFIHHHNADIDALTAERDRLAAENAELRKKLDPNALTICYMAGRSTGDVEARAMAKRLRAANATLDALREVVPQGTRWCVACEKMTHPDKDDADFCGVCEGEDYWHRGPLADIHAILYPTEVP